jgi:hypothetical protein
MACAASAFSNEGMDWLASPRFGEKEEEDVVVAAVGGEAEFRRIATDAGFKVPQKLAVRKEVGS